MWNLFLDVFQFEWQCEWILCTRTLTLHVFIPGERGIIHLHNLIWFISMVSRKLTMERELLQYINIFNITVYVDNILAYHHSLSVGITIQLPDNLTHQECKQDHSSLREQHIVQQKTERETVLLHRYFLVLYTHVYIYMVRQ